MTKKVIIAGGGIAGLAAARELAGRGINTTLLEAKSRFGGRIHTVTEGSFPIELGAEFIHGRNRALLKAIKEAGLTTSRVAFSRNLAENGRLREANMWQTINDVIGRIDPRQPDCSFAQFLAHETLDDRARRIVRGYAEGFDAAHVERISAHSLLKAQISAAKMDGDWQGRVNEGYSALVEYLEREAAAKGGRLIKGARVRQVRWKPGNVEVAWQAGRKTYNATANAALLTLPLGVLKAGIVGIDPPLPEKQMTVRELEFGNVLKVILVFRERWWPKPGDGFFHALDQPLPTWWSDPRGPILTGWAGGPKADSLLSLSALKLKTLCLEILGRIFSESPSRLRKRLAAVYNHHWENDPDIRGSYSYIPVNGLDLPKALAAPVAETLFFAGEATVADAQMGTVFGALETGLRAAREIATALL